MWSKLKMEINMEAISIRELNANRTKFLSAALNGEHVTLKSRLGKFKIVPVKEKDTLTDRICHGLEQVKMIREGNLPRRTIKDLLDEL